MSEAFYEAMKEGKILQVPSEYKENHLKDFQESGLTLETLTKAGYRSEKDGWTVPYINPSTNEEYYRRKKLDGPEIKNKGRKNERRIRYKTPKGEKNHLYFSKQFDLNKDFPKEQACGITEGEKKTDKFIQDMGIPCVGLSGVYGWSSEGKPIKDLEFLCKKFGVFQLLFDSDYKINPQVQKAKEELIEAIESFGAIAVDCSLPGPEKGLDDFLVARGKDELEKHLIQCMKIKTEQIKNEKAIEKAAWKMLKTPNMLQEILDDVHSLGIIGENDNILRIYLSFITHKLDSCLGFILKGSTSSGKTTLVKTIAKLLPEGVVHDVTSQSLNALNYWTDISHKIIIVTEARPPDDKFWEIDSAWRQLIEDNKITRVIVDANEKDINKKRKVIIVYGPIVYCCTTTQPKLHAENENRLLIFYTDDSPEHVQEIIKRQFQSITEINPDIEKKQQFIIAKHRKAIELLKPYKLNAIQIPYGKQLSLSNFGPEASRDAKKLVKMIRSKTLLFQYQRSAVQLAFTDTTERLKDRQGDDLIDVVQSNSKEGGLVASKSDYEVAYWLLKDCFDSNSTEISQDLQDKWKTIQNKHGDESFSRKDLEKLWRLKKTRVHSLVKEMLKEEMLTKLDEKDDEYVKGQGEQYRLRAYNLRGAGLVTPDNIPNDDVQESMPTLLRNRVNDVLQTQSQSTVKAFTTTTERSLNSE